MAAEKWLLQQYFKRALAHNDESALVSSSPPRVKGETLLPELISSLLPITLAGAFDSVFHFGRVHSCFRSTKWDYRIVFEHVLPVLNLPSQQCRFSTTIAWSYLEISLNFQQGIISGHLAYSSESGAVKPALPRLQNIEPSCLTAFFLLS